MKVGDNNVIESKGKSRLIVSALVRFSSCRHWGQWRMMWWHLAVAEAELQLVAKLRLSHRTHVCHCPGGSWAGLALAPSSSWRWCLVVQGLTALRARLSQGFLSLSASVCRQERDPDQRLHHRGLL